MDRIETARQICLLFFVDGHLAFSAQTLRPDGENLAVLGDDPDSRRSHLCIDGIDNFERERIDPFRSPHTLTFATLTGYGFPSNVSFCCA